MLKQRLNALIALLLSLIPEALPQTEAEHQKWAGELLALAKLPDNYSFRLALATQVLHLPAGLLYKSRHSFIKELKRSIANQAAYNTMNDLKEQEKRERLLEDSKIQEATAVVEQEVS